MFTCITARIGTHPHTHTHTHTHTHSYDLTQIAIDILRPTMNTIFDISKEGIPYVRNPPSELRAAIVELMAMHCSATAFQAFWKVVLIPHTLLPFVCSSTLLIVGDRVCAFSCVWLRVLYCCL
jgi:hypothetical protein